MEMGPPWTDGSCGGIVGHDAGAESATARTRRTEQGQRPSAEKMRRRADTFGDDYERDALTPCRTPAHAVHALAAAGLLDIGRKVTEFDFGTGYPFLRDGEQEGPRPVPENARICAKSQLTFETDLLARMTDP